MKWFRRSAKANVSRCYYCGAGMASGAVRFIVVGGQTVGVHRRHPRRKGEVAG